MKNNIVIEIPATKKEVLRVAAYCRVSTAYEEQQTSLNSQIQYYTDHINNHEGWVLVGIYSEQVSGTRFDNRIALNRMMKDYCDGKIDYIITKSISRFGRNTLPFLQSFNELVGRGITIYFEMERLDSSDWRMSKIIAAAAAIAQNESESKSANIKWGIQRSFEIVKYYDHICFGYENGKSFVYIGNAIKLPTLLWEWPNNSRLFLCSNPLFMRVL